MNWNYPVSAGDAVRETVNGSLAQKKSGKTNIENWLTFAFLATALLIAVGVAFHFVGGRTLRASGSTSAHRPIITVSEINPSAPSVVVSKPTISWPSVNSRPALPKSSAANLAMSKPQSISLPLFFEPNQGQTDPSVKFLARGSGYGLFLTADEAVLQLHPRPVVNQESVLNHKPLPLQPAGPVIRMHLDGANAAALVSGADQLPGKSNYFIGNDSSKWRHDIPQFARVEYKSVYPGVNLVYYGDQGQLEYDFRLAPSADPNQITLSFTGASTRIESGDLLLSTATGDVRFRAPRIYQQDGTDQTAIAGSFRQLADNKIGFTIGDYDHSRELVIDPILSYSTYLGGSGSESFTNVAVDSAGLIYVAGSTTSSDFPLPAVPPAIAPIQGTLDGAQNIFIAVINPGAALGTSQLVYATYLGGSGSDYPAGIAATNLSLDPLTSGIDIYVAGSTTSPNFPVNGALTGFQVGPPAQAGIHGFVTRINLGTTSSIRYSTYLAGTNLNGNATDTVTGLAIDSQGDAFVTGITTSTDDQSNGFPSNPNAFQLQSNAPNQFFASEINTKGSGTQSMIYSTYFGGGNPQNGATQGGGIAIDSTGNMYITGGTNFLQSAGNGGAAFPLNDAYQGCLDESSKTSCSLNNPTALDAFVAKIAPKPGYTLPIYCTYLGGSGDEVGYGIAVDTTNIAYITGSTTSIDWIIPGGAFQTANGGGASDAFIAKIGNIVGTQYPLNYFTYLGGSGADVGQAIVVDSLQAAHVVGTTSSATNFPVTLNTFQSSYGGGSTDAFVASITSTLSGVGQGDFVSYLGGNSTDAGTGVALDSFGATYAVGTTVSPNFPTQGPFQASLNGAQDAFVSKVSANSILTLTYPNTSPSPNPVNAGTQVAFTFNIVNTGPDNATSIVFNATGLPTTGLTSQPTATVKAGTGSCFPAQSGGQIIPCIITTLAAGSTATVEVDLTPAITGTAKSISISGNVSANNSSQPPVSVAQPAANIVDFTVTASTTTPTIVAGDVAAYQVVFTPTSQYGYSGTITPSQTTTPSMVTATTPTFSPTSVVLSGTSPGTTTLTIPTVARPTNTGSLFRHSSFYATWLPIGGLSLVGLGIGAGRKRRRWLAGLVLCLIAGAIILQAGCGSSSSAANNSGGTLPQIYTITISGSAGTGASHSYQVHLQVN